MITIRPATEKDLPEILSIYNEVILNTTAVYDYEPHTLEMRKSWLETKVHDHFPVLIAAEENSIAGFGALGPFRAWAAYKYTVENSVYVAAGSRGKGVGRLLLQHLIEAATQMNMHVVLAGIDATNEASLKLHSRFGFTKVAHFSEVGYKFGRWLDLVFLQLVLPGKHDSGNDRGAFLPE